MSKIVHQGKKPSYSTFIMASSCKPNGQRLGGQRPWWPSLPDFLVRPASRKASVLMKRPLRPSLSPGPGGIDGTGSQGKWEDGSSPGMKYNEACPVPRATGTRVTPTGSPTQALPWPTQASRLKRLLFPWEPPPRILPS